MLFLIPHSGLVYLCLSAQVNSCLWHKRRACWAYTAARKCANISLHLLNLSVLCFSPSKRRCLLVSTSGCGELLRSILRRSTVSLKQMFCKAHIDCVSVELKYSWNVKKRVLLLLRKALTVQACTDVRHFMETANSFCACMVAKTPNSSVYYPGLLCVSHACLVEKDKPVRYCRNEPSACGWSWFPTMIIFKSS